MHSFRQHETTNNTKPTLYGPRLDTNQHQQKQDGNFLISDLTHFTVKVSQAPCVGNKRNGKLLTFFPLCFGALGVMADTTATPKGVGDRQTKPQKLFLELGIKISEC